MKTIFEQMFKLLFLGVLSSMLFSCGAAQKLKMMNGKEAAYNQYQLGNKEIRFLATTRVGQPQYYDRLKYLIDKSKSEEYVMFYENIDLNSHSDEELRKIRKMFGNLPTDSGYAAQYKSLAPRGYQVQKTQELLGLKNTNDYNVDISGRMLIAAYESKFGTIPLTPQDLKTPLHKAVLLKLPKPKVEKILADTRKLYLAQQIKASEYTKLLLVYDFSIEDKLINELKIADTTLSRVNNYSTTGITDSALGAYYTPPVKVDYQDTIGDGHILVIKNYVNLNLQLVNYLELFSLDSRGTRYDVYTNNSTSLRFAFDYAGISGWYTFSPDLFPNNRDEATYGKTSGFSTGFSVINRKWFSDYNFRYIKGFYLDNPHEVYSGSFTEGQKLIRPDLYHAALSANVGYKFNERLSLRAVRSQTEIQHKSAGSFVVDGRFKYYEMQDDAEPRFDSISKTRNLEIGSTLGYIYTWVPIRNFYFSLGLNAGFGLNMGRAFRVENNQEARTADRTLVYLMSGNGAIGYNSERFYLGARTNFNAGSFLKEVPFYDTGFNNFYAVFVGFRVVPKNFRR